jgi:hypothetical protein
MRTIYVTAQLAPTAGAAPPNQLTAHNIKVSSFVTIGKTQLHQLTSADDDGTSLFVKPLLQSTAAGIIDQSFIFYKLLQSRAKGI